MAERGSRVGGSESSGPEDTGHGTTMSPPAARPRRVVALRTTSGPSRVVAPAWASGASPSGEAPGWAADPDAVEEPDDAADGGGWSAARASSASALAESVFPFGAELPFEPDPEAAAFLNAPRRPLGFYVAPFGTPPFGNAPAGQRSVFGGPVEGRPAGAARRGAVGQPAWGPAYPAGA